jgi:CarD family transcriptional regulator
VVVLKGLTVLSRKKTLSFREKRMLDRAKFLIVSEIAEVEGKPLASVEERVDRALSKTVDAPLLKKPVQKPVGLRRRTSDA